MAVHFSTTKVGNRPCRLKGQERVNARPRFSFVIREVIQRNGDLGDAKVSLLSVTLHFGRLQ
jgi:hypothetical protein